MSVQPSVVALSFTNFLLNVSTWRYTAEGLTMINEINTAATNQTSVTDARYQEYGTYTNFRFEYFVMYRDLAT